MTDNQAEVDDLAKRLYERAKSIGNLKRKGLGAIATSDGQVRNVSSPTTWKDYRPEARAILRRRGGCAP